MPQDPYRYFRLEARELLDGLTRGVLEIERGASSKDVVGRLLRFAHTLKGAARVVKLTEIGRQAHAVEDVLAPFREGSVSIPPERVNELLGLIDGMAAGLNSLDHGEARAPVAPAVHEVPAIPAIPEMPIEAVRVDLDEMDRLLEAVAEVTVQIHSLERETEGLARARHLAGLLAEILGAGAKAGENEAAGSNEKPRVLAEEIRQTLDRSARSVESGVEQVSRELDLVRDAANRLRLQPAASIFGSLERAARDAAQLLGKRITFRTAGGEGRIDAHVLAGLGVALAHVVRNAVAHGIELETDRVSRGKPPAGDVFLEVETRGSQIAFVCRDDGRGIDWESLKRAALRAGVLGETEAAQANADSIFQLLLKGGLTTSKTLTEVSGRAIGFDVVRETAARFGGQVFLRSEAGRGTSVELRVPVSMASLRALVVDAEGTVAALPFECVRRTIRLVDADIVRASNGESIVHDGRVVPYVPLTRALRRPTGASGPRSSFSAVVIEAAGELAAVGVSTLLGIDSVITRPLPAHIRADSVVVGASLDADGNPLLVLDPQGLVAAAQTARPMVTESAATPRRPILVVDDSLTTRMLEQSILESAGYEVELATSAEEALEKAKKKHYGLFVVDVEMPGMNGFEFVATTRADPVLRETPAILVTSRGSVEDRRRGREAGASEYVVKGEFDQGRLLQVIRELNG